MLPSYKVSANAAKISAEQTMGGLSLRSNVSWTLVANIIVAGFHWGVLVALAKIGSPEMVGQMGIGYAIGAPVVMFANLHLRQIQATDARNEYLFGHYLALRTLTSSLALLVITVITLLTTYSWSTKAVIIIIGFAKVVESFEDIIYGLLQKHERMDRMAISMISKATLELVSVTLGVLFTGSLLGGMFGLLVSKALVMLIYDWQSALIVLNPAFQSGSARSKFSPGLQSLDLLKPLWSPLILKQLAWLSLPLAIVVTLNSLNVNIPRYFISYYLDEQMLGIFVALAYVTVGGNMVVMALGLSVGPRLAKYFARAQTTAFRNLLLQGSLIVILLGLFVVVVTQIAGRELLTLLYQPQYASQVKVFLWLMIAATVSYLATFLRQGITAARYFRVQLPIYVLSAITMLWSCYFFIPRYGLMGAAYASLSAALVALLLNGSVVLYILRHHEDIHTESFDH
jgi:O-antigen/teichoic acid export membrane protein